MKKSLIIALIIVVIILIIIHVIIMPCVCGTNEPQPENMHPMVNKTRYVTLHTVVWCPHCKNMAPVWERVKLATQGSGIVFRELDEDVAKSVGVSSYPTIRMVTENGAMVQYKGGPNFESLRNWVLAPHHNL